MAGPSDTVCSDCDSADGTCYNNVVRRDRLTSGFLSGQYISGVTVSKPTNSGTCSAECRVAHRLSKFSYTQ